MDDSAEFGEMARAIRDRLDGYDQRHERTALILKNMDRQLNQAKSLGVLNARQIEAGRKAARQASPRATLIKILTAKLIAATKTYGRDDGSEIAAQIYPGNEAVIAATKAPREFLMKAATSPAMTTVGGWASELAAQAIFPGLLASLAPRSVYAQLKSRGISVSLAGIASMRFPARGPTTAGGSIFVGEGLPIPVRQLSLSTGAVLAGHKAATISLFSGEVARASIPAIETVIAQAMGEDIASAVDAALLGSSAPSASASGGLLNGLTPLAASTAADLSSAVAEDLSNLAAAIPAAQELAFIMSSEQATSAALLCAGFSSLDTIISDTVPHGLVLAIDAADFASVAENGDLEAESGMTTVDDDNPLPVATGTSGAGAITAAPHLSAWQTDVIALRAIENAAWAMRRPGRIAYIAAVKW